LKNNYNYIKRFLTSLLCIEIDDIEEKNQGNLAQYFLDKAIISLRNSTMSTTNTLSVYNIDDDIMKNLLYNEINQHGGDIKEMKSNLKKIATTFSSNLRKKKISRSFMDNVAESIIKLTANTEVTDSDTLTNPPENQSINSILDEKPDTIQSLLDNIIVEVSNRYNINLFELMNLESINNLLNFEKEKEDLSINNSTVKEKNSLSVNSSNNSTVKEKK